MKVIGNSIALSIAGLLLIGIFSSFIANEEFLQYYIMLGLAFSILIVFLIVKKIMREGSEYSAKMRAQGKSPIFGVIAIVIMVPALTVASFYKGLPVALNFIFGTAGQIEVVVESKPAIFYSKRCSGRVDLYGYEYFSNNYICGVAEPAWRSLRSGDKVILIGKKSIFGFQYEHR